MPDSSTPGESRPPGPMYVNRRAAEMDWSGIQTFMKAPVCLTPEDLRAGGVDVAVGGAPWDGTASGLTGTHLGPRAIRQGEALDSADHLYISLDVDVADPAYAPGTGTPEPGGLTSGEVLWAVRRLAAEAGMVGMDVVELSPPYDVGPNITALFARRAVMEALTGTAMRRIGLTRPDYVDPRSAGTGTSRTFREEAPPKGTSSPRPAAAVRHGPFRR